MMKDVLKRLLGLALVGTSLFTFNVTSRAAELPSAAPGTDVLVTEETATEEKVAAVVTLTIEDEYIFVLNENGEIVLIEGPKEELIAMLFEEGKTLNESILAIAATYGEEAKYTVAVTSDNEELAAAITESLKEVVGEEVEVETETSEQPEFIARRFAMAKELGITPGKMRLLEKLAAAIGEEINYEEWSQKSVKEIMSEVKANRLIKDKEGIQDKAAQLEKKKVVSDKKPIEVKTEKPKPENRKETGKESSKGSSPGKGKNK